MSKQGLKQEQENHDDFYRPLLAAARIHGEEDVPQHLLRAVSMLVRRETDFDVVLPEQCRGLVALVLLARNARLV